MMDDNRSQVPTYLPPTPSCYDKLILFRHFIYSFMKDTLNQQLEAERDERQKVKNITTVMLIVAAGFICLKYNLDI